MAEPSSIQFQSTRPLRGATGLPSCHFSKCGFQSTRPLRGATAFDFPNVRQQINFNPRAPYGARLTSLASKPRKLAFQSTRPLRGATSRSERRSAPWYFNPRAPYGARLSIIKFLSLCLIYFNPRAPYGARPPPWMRPASLMYFNPRAPYGARLASFQRGGRHADISIHAPLTGRDQSVFNYDYGFADISIHAPLTGRDLALAGRISPFPVNFNPRAPYGARLMVY